MEYFLMVREFGTKETGSWRTERPVIDLSKCNFCSRCIDFCPEGVLREKNGAQRRLEVDLVFCKGCGICAEVCNLDAIAMEEES